MTRRSYPQLGGVAGGGKGEREACARKASQRVEVQWSYMRGEDESYDVCGKHAAMARENFRRFIAHLQTKDRFLAKRATPETTER